MNILKSVLLIGLGIVIFTSPLVLVKKTKNNAHIALEKNHSNKYDYAIIGDSRCHTGVSPKHVTEEVEKFTKKIVNGFNYCVDGSDVLHHSSLVLGGILNQLKGTKVVVWAIHPMQFDSTRINNHLEWLRFADVIPLVRAGAPKELILDLITGTVFPQWRHRPMFASLKSDYMERAAIKTLLAQERLLNLTVEKDIDTRKYFDGGEGFEPFKIVNWEKRFNQGTTAYVADYNKLTIDEWRMNLVKIVSDKIKSMGGTLVLVQLPTASVYKEKFSSQTKYNYWRTLVHKLSIKENIIYLDHAPLHLSEDTQFGDPAHMAVDAAIDYSRYLARSLSELVFAPDAYQQVEVNGTLLGEI